MYDADHAARLLQPLCNRLVVGPGTGEHHLDRDLALHAGVKREPHCDLGTLAQHFAQAKLPQMVRGTQLVVASTVTSSRKKEARGGYVNNSQEPVLKCSVEDIMARPSPRSGREKAYFSCTVPLTLTTTADLPASMGTGASAMEDFSAMAMGAWRGKNPWSLALMDTSRSA